MGTFLAVTLLVKHWLVVCLTTEPWSLDCSMDTTGDHFLGKMSCSQQSARCSSLLLYLCLCIYVCDSGGGKMVLRAG